MKSKTKDTTDEYSFVLKPATYGIGVFAAHPIAKGAYLRLLGDEAKEHEASRVLKVDDVPERFRMFCLERGDELICPSDFGVMAIGWHLNHSEAPNAAHRDYRYFATRDIAEGEEITIDYNSLEEPEGQRDAFVKKSE